MPSGHFDLDSYVASKWHKPSRLVLRRTRLCILLVLALFGLHLLAVGPGAGNGNALTAQQAAPALASVQMAQESARRASLTTGMGAGTSSSERTAATLPEASCNPFDVIC